jgi:hypothetical protein
MQSIARFMEEDLNDIKKLKVYLVKLKEDLKRRKYESVNFDKLKSPTE